MLRTTMRGGMGLGVAAMLACGAMWLAPGAGAGGVGGAGFGVATVAACPPSEGELDLMGYDLSGDGVVQLPEGVRWRVMPTSQAGAESACGGSKAAKGVTLVLEDPSRENHRVMTMRLTTLAATEVQEWLGDAVSDQQGWLEAKSYNEKPGLACALDVQQCRTAANVKAGGCPHAAAEAMAKKIEMPRMYVSVASANGQHGWSLLPAARQAAGDEPMPEAEQCWKKRCTEDGQIVKKDAPADQRITLTAYQIRDEANRPLSVKMDVKTARKLASDLKEALAGKTPKAEPVIEKAEASAKGVS